MDPTSFSTPFFSMEKNIRPAVLVVEGVGGAMGVKKVGCVGCDGWWRGAITLCHVIFELREDHMTPRVALFFRCLLWSASAGALHTHPLAIPTLGYIWDGWKGWRWAYSTEAPRRTT